LKDVVKFKLSKGSLIAVLAELQVKEALGLSLFAIKTYFVCAFFIKDAIAYLEVLHGLPQLIIGTLMLLNDRLQECRNSLLTLRWGVSDLHYLEEVVLVYLLHNLLEVFSKLVLWR
jgi:hypothetical protein